MTTHKSEIRDHMRIEVRPPDRAEVLPARLDVGVMPASPVELRLVVEPARARRGLPVTVHVMAGRSSPPSGAVWLEASGRVDPGPGARTVDEPSGPATPGGRDARVTSDAPERPSWRCWIASAPLPPSGTGEFELFQCRVTAGPEHTRGEILIAAGDTGSGATVYRWVPLQ